ncbi:hypothetical protein MTP99_000514 [Tenebrio molitor]|nr:hypothetical protein MTP99_000514 [Tenebrio molitor]
MFSLNFVVIVICFFYVTVQLQANEVNWNYLLYTVLSAVNFIICSVVVCDVCYSTVEEANKSGELIHKIDTEDRDMIDAIEMFSLQITNSRVEFSTAGFFPINYTLVFSIIGGVTTYIIILIQVSASLSKTEWNKLTLEVV